MLKYKNSGFTLPEIMLSISLIAILTLVSFGDITSILGQSAKKKEESQLKEIKKAMQAYLKDRGSLPDEATWSTDLAPYTDLSPDQILSDAWFRLRQYKVFNQTEVFRSVSFETYYGMVYSLGEDGAIDADAVLAGLAPANGSVTLSDYPNDGTNMATFLAIDAGKNAGDDQFFKVSDRQEKMKNYEVTMNRLGAISKALQVYGQSMLNFAISNNEAGWASKLFYPPSEVEAGSVADNATYGDDVVSEINTFLGRSTVRTNGVGVTDTIRRTDMVGLMRMLGLPDSNCCSALELGADDLPNPFYYFSNPRRKEGAVCSANRASDPAIEIVLPPRLSIDIIANETCG